MRAIRWQEGRVHLHRLTSLLEIIQLTQILPLSPIIITFQPCYTSMEKYHGFDQHFYDFLFAKIVSDGGLRMQLIASDLVKQLQTKFDPKDPLNLYRKQYGNIFEALKAIKSKPYFLLDNMVIKMKPPEEVRTLGIRKDLMAKYEQKLIINRNKEIEIMKINNQNQCARCGRLYNVNVNPPNACGKSTHQPKY